MELLPADLRQWSELWLGFQAFLPLLALPTFHVVVRRDVVILLMLQLSCFGIWLSRRFILIKLLLCIDYFSDRDAV